MLDVIFEIGFSVVVVSTCMAIVAEMLAATFTTVKKTFFNKNEK